MQPRGLTGDHTLGLQDAAAPRPPDPEGRSASAGRPSWDPQSWALPTQTPAGNSHMAGLTCSAWP